MEEAECIKGSQSSNDVDENSGGDENNVDEA